MIAPRTPTVLLGVAGITLAVCACDKSGRSPSPTWTVPGTDIELPQESGWTVDDNLRLEDSAKGGIALRLVHATRVAGSPRIDVVLAPIGPRPTKLDSYVTQNLREMAALEAQNKIKMLQVAHRPGTLGPRRAYRARHEYTSGTGESQIAITQVSMFFVLDGRGVTITAAGRTELFHPLAGSVERVIAGVSVRGDAVANVMPVPASTDVAEPRPEQQIAPQGTPVDLGKIGGK